MRGICTLHELRTVYTLDDLMDFHDALDEWDVAKWEAEQQQYAEITRDANRRIPR